MKTFDARTLARWRKWLADHHHADSEVWLIFHKQHTGKPSVAYLDAVDEALCYGWIDGLVKRLDEDRYARRFTPTKASQQVVEHQHQALRGAREGWTSQGRREDALA